MNKTIIVTGSSGFIGSFLVKELLQKNYKVVGIDLIKSNQIHPNYQEVFLDLTDEKSLNNYFLDQFNDSQFYVFHLASKIKVDESMIKPDLYYTHNIIGTINLLNWCIKKNIYLYLEMIIILEMEHVLGIIYI